MIPPDTSRGECICARSGEIILWLIIGCGSRFKKLYVKSISSERNSDMFEIHSGWAQLPMQCFHMAPVIFHIRHWYCNDLDSAQQVFTIWSGCDHDASSFTTLFCGVVIAVHVMLHLVAVVWPGPIIEEIFELGLTEGQSMTVGCWINETVVLERRPN